MNEIYVTGHRNPDTDSIVAAMAYAALKNALGEKEYVAVHLGTISDETNRMLERFHFNPPRFIQNVRTQVRDLEFDIGAVIYRCETGLQVHFVVFAGTLKNIESALALTEYHLGGGKNHTILRHELLLALRALVHVVQDRLAGDGHGAGIRRGIVRLPVSASGAKQQHNTQKHR